MKKIFAIALAVVMVLSIASVASAFVWTKPADTTTADNFGYSIDVIKFTRSTGTLGSSYFNADDAATAVNGADVYYAIKLVVDNPSDDVKKLAKADVSFTAISGMENETVRLSKLGNGVYYYGVLPQGRVKTPGFYPIQDFVSNELLMNATAETPVFAARCLDTDTAKVAAKVYSKIDLWKTYQYPDMLEVGDYKVSFNKTPKVVGFYTAAGAHIVNFYLNDDGLVTKVETGAASKELVKLYQWLNAGDADSIEAAIDNKEMYMTNDNLLAAFGWSYSQSDSITWNANSTPIILDPTVSIPKTGDNASVIGFAMIMVAVVAAAVAVRKVNA